MRTSERFILVVDDEDDLRQALADVVARHFPDMPVVACANGTDALREAQLAQKAGRQLALAITDEVMPGLRGIDLMEALSHIYPDAARAIITGYASVESAVSGLRIGVDDFLQKPFQESELVAACQRLLATHRLRAENRQLRERLRTAYLEAASLTHLVFEPIDVTLQQLLADEGGADEGHREAMRRSQRNMAQLAYVFQCASQMFDEESIHGDLPSLGAIARDALAALADRDRPVPSPGKVRIDADRKAATIIVERCMECAQSLLADGQELEVWILGAGPSTPDGWPGHTPPRDDFTSPAHAYLVLSGPSDTPRAAADLLASSLRGGEIGVAPEGVGLKLSQMYLEMIGGDLAYGFPESGVFQFWLKFRAA